jgi:hypothetical protein
MRTMIARSLLLVFACVGCSQQWVRTGEPSWSNCANDAVAVPPDNFDAVSAGMTRSDVVAYLGTPTDNSLNVMHWEMGAFKDAWVLFDDTGEKVASKCWQDDRTLRLEDASAVK